MKTLKLLLATVALSGVCALAAPAAKEPAPKDHKGTKECNACCKSPDKCDACCHDKGKGEECRACCFKKK
jgi:hypothetical protein